MPVKKTMRKRAPAKRTKRPVGARRRKSRKKVHPNDRARVVHMPLNFPDTIFCKMRYQARIALNAATAGSGVVSIYDFRNSVRDPDYSGTGGTPNYWSEYTAVFNKYTVFGSKFTVRPIDVDASTSVWDVAIVPTWATGYVGVSNTMEQIKSMKYARWTVVSNQFKYPTLSEYMSTSKIYGVPKIAVGMEDDYSALITSDPVNAWYWQLCAIPADRITTAAILYCEVTYDLYVRWSVRHTISQ